jgi:adenylyltransferase/sulfurtransferase
MEDVGKKKAEVAKQHLQKLNPHIIIKAITERVRRDNVLEILNSADVVIDATDNFETRFTLGDYTSIHKISLVFAAISGFEGQLSVFNYQQGPCFRDFYPTEPSGTAIPDCSTNGVIGFVPGILGTLQAAEALKIITGIGTVMSGKLMVIDLLSLNKKEFIIKKADASASTGKLNIHHNNIHTSEKMIKEINSTELKSRLTNHANEIFLLDVREPQEYSEFNIGGTLIPLGELPEKIASLPGDKEIVIVCKSGVRSMRAAQFIAEKKSGVSVYNLKGGLLAWLSETK